MQHPCTSGRKVHNDQTQATTPTPPTSTANTNSQTTWRAGAIAQHDADRQRIAAEAACAVWADGRINDGAAMWLVADELGVPSGVLAGWLAEYVEGGEA